MDKKLFLILFVYVALSGCGKAQEQITLSNSTLEISQSNFLNKKKEEQLKTIKIDPSTERILLNDFLTIKKIIPLETNKHSLLGTIKKVKIHEEMIYVLDSKNTKKLAVFDLEGNYKFKIGTIGGGSSEYTGILDFTIDPESNKIILLDKNLDLIIYGLDGKYEGRRIIKTSTKSIETVGDGLIAMYSGDPSNRMPFGNYRLKIYDFKNNKLVSKNLFADINLRKKFPTNPKNFSSFGAIISIYTASSDTIYQIKGAQFSATYFLDFGKYSRPTNFYKNSSPMPAAFELLMTSNVASAPRIWEESASHVYFNYSIKDKIYQTIFSKALNEIKFSSYNIVDDYFLGLDFSVVGNYQNEFIQVVDPGHTAMIRDYYVKNGQEDKLNYPNKFKKLLMEIEADENPLLVLTEIKE